MKPARAIMAIENPQALAPSRSPGSSLLARPAPSMLSAPAPGLYALLRPLLGTRAARPHTRLPSPLHNRRHPEAVLHLLVLKFIFMCLGEATLG